MVISTTLIVNLLLLLLKSITSSSQSFLHSSNENNDKPPLRSLAPSTSNTACTTWIFTNIHDINLFQSKAYERCTIIKARLVPSSQQECANCALRRMNQLYYLERYSYIATACLIKAKECPGFNAIPVIHQLQKELDTNVIIHRETGAISNITRKEFEYDVPLPLDVFTFENVEHTQKSFTFRLKSKHPFPIECFHDIYNPRINEQFINNYATKFYVQPENLEGILVSETFPFEKYDGEVYKISMNCTSLAAVNNGTFQMFDVSTVNHTEGSIPTKDPSNILQYPFTPKAIVNTTEMPTIDSKAEFDAIIAEPLLDKKIELVSALSNLALAAHDNITIYMQHYLNFNEALKLIDCKASTMTPQEQQECLKNITQMQIELWKNFRINWPNTIRDMTVTDVFAKESNIKLYFMTICSIFNNPYTLDHELGKQVMNNLGGILSNMRGALGLIPKTKTNEHKDVIMIAAQAASAAITYKSLYNNVMNYQPTTAKSELMKDSDLILIKDGVIKLGEMFANYTISPYTTPSFKFELVPVATSTGSTANLNIQPENIAITIPTGQIKTLGPNVNSVGVITFDDYPLLSLIGKTAYTPNVVSVQAYDNNYKSVVLDNLTESSPLQINYNTGATQGFPYCYSLPGNSYSTNRTTNTTSGAVLQCKTTVLGEMIMGKMDFNTEPELFIADIPEEEEDPGEDFEKPLDPNNPDGDGDGDGGKEDDGKTEPDTPLVPGDNNNENPIEKESLWWIALIVLVVVALICGGAFLLWRFYFKPKHDKKFEIIDTGRSVNTVNTVGIELSSKPVEVVQVTRSQFNPLKKV